MDSHAAIELNVFACFLECCALRVVAQSVQKRSPPEPDIACELEEGGGVAFELVELADSILCKTPYDTADHRRYFEDSINALGPQGAASFRNRYETAFLHFSFKEGATQHERRKGIAEVVRWMARLCETASGGIPLPEGGLPGIEAISVRLGSGRGPMFDDMKGVAFMDPTEDSILGKLRRRYQTELPVELLAYYELHPVLPESHWLPSLVAVLKEELPASQFRRVWVFDKNSRGILLVWPDLCSGSE